MSKSISDEIRPIYEHNGKYLYSVYDNQATHKILKDDKDAYWCVPYFSGQRYWYGSNIEYISKTVVRSPDE